MLKKSNDNFVKASLTLMSGSIVAQILAICISPIMTRIYSTNEIGEYTLILTAVSMFGSVICLRYDMSIVPEKEEKYVFTLIKLAIVITILASIVVAVGYTCYCYMKNTMKLGFSTAVCWIFAILLLTGIGNVLTAYNNRYKEYKLMTSVNVVREIGRDISLIGLGVAGVGLHGLLMSQFISVFLGINQQGKNLKQKNIKWNQIKYEDLRECAIRYKKQPIFSVPASFVSNVSYSVLNILVNNLFGMSTLALYSMSFRILGLPLSLVSGNMSKVFFEKSSREYERNKNFFRTFISTTCLLLVVAIPMVIILMTLAPMAFGIFFGNDWTEAGIYVRYLAPMFGIRLVVSALTPTMTIVNKQNIEFIIQCFFLIGAVICYIAIGGNYGINYFLIGISISYSVVYVIYYFIMLKLAMGKETYD